MILCQYAKYSLLCIYIKVLLIDGGYLKSVCFYELGVFVFKNIQEIIYFWMFDKSANLLPIFSWVFGNFEFLIFFRPVKILLRPSFQPW